MKDYDCADCGHEFTQFGNLKIHMKVHRKGFTCEECGDAFHKKSEVDDHVRTVHVDVKNTKSEDIKNAELDETENQHGETEQTLVAMDASPDDEVSENKNGIKIDDITTEGSDSTDHAKMEVKVDADAFSQIIEQVDEQQDEISTLQL